MDREYLMNYWLTSWFDHTKRAAHLSRMSRLSLNLNEFARAVSEQNEAADEYSRAIRSRYCYEQSEKGMY